MGQFKPMVKMETTEPSVILKLKKGGHVMSKAKAKEENGHKPMCKADGGMMDMLSGAPTLVGRPATAAPVSMPGKPSMSARRKAMKMGMTRRPNTAPVPVAGLKQASEMPAMPAMKKGGKAEGGKMDMAQDKAMIKKAFKQHDMQEHKGGKGTKLALKKGGMSCATGGVAMGNAGGYATGGVVMGQGGYAKGGGVEGNVSGTPAGVSNTKTGEVRLGNAGGFKKGGATKKFADGGSVQDDGKAVKMPQGSKRPSSPVSINRLSGTYKKGGNVTKMAKGGQMSDAEMDRRTNEAYENSEKTSRELEDAMNPISMIKEGFGKVKDYFSGKKPPAGSVTKSKESVTVSKKRGGMC